MEYRERDGSIYRGERESLGVPFMTEVLTNGKWRPVQMDFGLKAAIQGATMTEEQAKEFAGDEWPLDDAEADPETSEEPDAD